VLVERLLAERPPPVSERRGLILSLGEFTALQLPLEKQQPLIRQLLKWYEEDNDPGIHGAIDWLLRHGKQGPSAAQVGFGNRLKPCRGSTRNSHSGKPQAHGTGIRPGKLGHTLTGDPRSGRVPDGFAKG